MKIIPRVFPIRSVAVIGAGPSGLAAAKYLLAEKAFQMVKVFDRRRVTGGMWNYTPPNLYNLDTAGSSADRGHVDHITPIYDELESNIPQTLMQYSDLAFPPGTQLLPAHDVVLNYLQRYGDDLRPFIAFETEVLRIERLGNLQWSLDVEDLATKSVAREVFDAVLIANGHFDTPAIPRATGLAEWQRKHPGKCAHSLTYRNASAYENQKVIVVGHSASGSEISTQIAGTAKHPVLVSVRRLPEQPAPKSSGKEFVSEIVEYLPESRGVRFADGRIEHDVDKIIYCTGYQSTFPFLDSLRPLYNGHCTQNLYRHVFYIPDTSLAFIAMPLKSIPFPLAENQAAVIARVWSGRLDLPSHTSMLQWDADLLARDGKRTMTPQEAAQFNAANMNDLYDWSKEAEQREGLENEGEGKISCHWSEKDIWLRGLLGPIKAAFNAKGVERHEIQTPEELGFDFDKSRMNL